jgi:hypothetical protein
MRIERSRFMHAAADGNFQNLFNLVGLLLNTLRYL